MGGVGFSKSWSLVAAKSEGFSALGAAFVVGIAIHKAPEGVALGAIARAALPDMLSRIETAGITHRREKSNPSVIVRKRHGYGALCLASVG